MKHETKFFYSVVYAADFQPLSVDAGLSDFDDIDDARAFLSRQEKPDELAILRGIDPARGCTECSLDGGTTWERYC